MAQFTIYNSSDASAPTLNGTTGSLVTVLDAILVNGYGAKAAAGWAKSYSGASKAAYRPAAGTRFYMRIQDDGPGAGTYKEARMVGFETMSDVDTGTGRFPSGATNLFIRKSATADATARAWVAYADGRTLYFFALTGDTANNYKACHFGDIYSVAPGDAYQCLVIGRPAENTGTYGELMDTEYPSSAAAGHFMARSYGGGGSAITVSKHGDNGKSGTAGYPTGALPGPNPQDGAYYLSPFWVCEASSASVRGRMRGMHHYCHLPASASDGATFGGAGDWAGKTFQIVKGVGYSGGGTLVPAAMETSDTLETN